MQKHEQADIDQPFRCPHRLGQEVALPECVGMDLTRISHSVIKQNLWNRRKESVHKAFERQNTEVLR